MRIRLDKYLADMGCGTRSQVKREIAGGSVMVNGAPARRPEDKIDTEKDSVVFRGSPLGYTEYEYFMLNKPAGVVSATEDRTERTVLDLIDARQRKDLFPVGRLDKDTEGLLLVTNDGGMAHRLLSPKKHVDKVYYAKVAGRITEEHVRLFAEGVDIGDEKPTLPAELTVLSSGEISEIELVIWEGRFHQVKRMFQAAGGEVIYLKRLRMGSLVLDRELQPGEYRKLTEEEVRALC